MGVAQPCERSQHEPVKHHNVKRAKTEGHTESEGKEAYGNVVGHNSAGCKGAEGQGRVEPDLSFFNLLNHMGRDHERYETAIQEGCAETVKETDEEGQEGKKRPRRCLAESVR